MTRGLARMVPGILLLGAVLIGVAGCRRAPAIEGIDRSGPDVTDPAGRDRFDTAEPVTDPFGPGNMRGDLDESDLGDAAASAPLLGSEGRLETVYFDFDQSAITAEARAALDRNAGFLRANPRLRVRIEAHCDERGTVEYNLALGDRRAHTAKNYLVQQGIEASRLMSVSFGEEHPADPGHDEAAWARNRRAEFHVQ